MTYSLTHVILCCLAVAPTTCFMLYRIRFRLLLFWAYSLCIKPLKVNDKCKCLSILLILTCHNYLDFKMLLSLLHSLVVQMTRIWLAQFFLVLHELCTALIGLHSSVWWYIVLIKCFLCITSTTVNFPPCSNVVSCKLNEMKISIIGFCRVMHHCKQCLRMDNGADVW